MHRFRTLAATLALAAFGLAPLTGHAQYDRPIGQPLGQAPWGGTVFGGAPAGGVFGGGYGGYPGTYAGQAVVCESHDGGFAECRTPFSGPPAIARTLSSSACVQGQTWGSRGAGSVWVMGGCRAEFVDAYAGQAGGGVVPYGQGDGYAIRCESDNGRQRDCQANVATRLTLVRQLSDSPCVEGQSWGSDNRGKVWVRYGCRGDFAPAQGWSGGAAPGTYGYGYAQAITCESVERRYNACTWDARWGRPYLAEQLSGDACQEGRSWGFDGRGQIWVDRGCRGRFAAR